ncbi:MAG: DUF302 domain-containing protein [Anaerolineales bacterium]|jgi:uncharacterized protein (DUF302 family)
MTDTIAFQTQLDLPYEQAIEKVTSALKAEGFGVLTRIDVKATLKEKLDQDFRPYVILGACNPPLAHRALQADPVVGVMLPCNVTVEESDGGALISIANPETMLSAGHLAEIDELKQVSAEARARLERVRAALSQ